jgi:hypothetical protein
MFTHSSAAYGSKIVIDLIGEIIYFPAWWYSRGLVNTAKYLLKFISDKEKSWGLFLWAKNIFRPMYAQRDWQGVLISVFMRIIQIIIRSIIMLFWCLVAIMIFIFWLILPPLVFFEILYQLNFFNLFN